MEKSSKRGKIPQQDWPSIIKRYEAGETLASIARTYDCSPPAISYILSRGRARDVAPESTEQGGISASQPQLIKISPTDTQTAEVAPKVSEMGEPAAPIPVMEPSDPISNAGSKAASLGSDPAPNAAPAASDRAAEIVIAKGSPPDRHIEGPARANPSANGSSPRSPDAAGAQTQSSDSRRTLHLSLPHDSAQQMETQHDDGRSADISNSSAIVPVGTLQQGLDAQAARPKASPYTAANNDGPIRPIAEGRAFIDRALRERVDSDISAFLAAFDAALSDDTIESRAALREATDRLLRAGARTRIELERQEARAPLPAREASGYRTPSWRPR
jgi:hypothetical protein